MGHFRLSAERAAKQENSQSLVIGGWPCLHIPHKGQGERESEDTIRKVKQASFQHHICKICNANPDPEASSLGT